MPALGPLLRQIDGVAGRSNPPNLQSQHKTLFLEMPWAARLVRGSGRTQPASRASTVLPQQGAAVMVSVGVLAHSTVLQGRLRGQRVLDVSYGAARLEGTAFS